MAGADLSKFGPETNRHVDERIWTRDSKTDLPAIKYGHGQAAPKNLVSKERASPQGTAG